MIRLHSAFDEIDSRLTRLSARHGVTLLRLSIGLVFLWFGVLKLFPGLSPAQDLAARTIGALTLGLVPGAVSVPHGYPGANVNLLTDDADIDPLTGMTRYSGLPVSIAPAQ